ncbi:hypothetical protein [Streptomyces sp. SID12501]|uniref:Uncharacterized protein n=1 Tax=Streptomyces sp. SID12501 TaxID=2706042 RepID=A0A6B3BDN1_9ACTN|nr:hypothetical protein [Streptomyces sp. SID12501]
MPRRRAHGGAPDGPQGRKDTEAKSVPRPRHRCPHDDPEPVPEGQRHPAERVVVRAGTTPAIALGTAVPMDRINVLRLHGRAVYGVHELPVEW